MACEWNYTGCNGYGPKQWSIVAPDAEGCHQSPVSIDPREAEYDKSLRDVPLHVEYDPVGIHSLHNTGHTIQIDAHLKPCKLTGGPLDAEDVYLLRQFHFHWGDNSCHGAEHQILGHEKYAAELHLVHWNSSQYSTFEEALKHPNGLCVLGVFIQASEEDNDSLEGLCKQLPNVKHVGSFSEIPDGYHADNLLPDDIESYWTYQGSLTTPPCHESVTFIIFRTPITASERQLEVFRSLTGYSKMGRVTGPLVNNFRPIQPLNGRVIKSSFRKFFA